MKMRMNVVLSKILLSGIFVVAMSQIYIQSGGNIDIRGYSNAGRYTYHYGDLHLDGGSLSTGGGWLYCNRVNVTGNGTAYVSGNLQVNSHATVSGTLTVMGNKYFLQPHPTDTTKFIRYSAMESGQSLTITRGAAKTVKGEAIISLPEHFSLVTNKNEPITVILTPESAPVLLYTKQKSTTEIVVAMKPADLRKHKDVNFSYQVSGVRDGFEKQEVIIGEDKINSPIPARTDVQKRINVYVKKNKDRQDLELANKRKEAEVTIQEETK
jgi:hypothetical protein